MKTTMIPIVNIYNRFDVRKTLNDDRVLHLAELYTNGVALPPITVLPLSANNGDAPTYAFLDGRHRAAAHALLDRQQIECVVDRSSKTLCETYAAALHSNWGGPLPPSRADIESTILRMLEAGVKPGEISKTMGFMPTGALRQYLTNAQSIIRRKSVGAALECVAGGFTVAQAAEKYGLKPEIVKDAVSGKRRKATNVEADALAGIKGYITMTLKASNTGISKKLGHLLKQVEDGDVRVSVAEKVIDAWDLHMKGTLHRIRDWRERLAQLEANK